jgi:hypothetical protein
LLTRFWQKYKSKSRYHKNPIVLPTLWLTHLTQGLMNLLVSHRSLLIRLWSFSSWLIDSRNQRWLLLSQLNSHSTFKNYWILWTIKNSNKAKFHYQFLARGHLNSQKQRLWVSLTFSKKSLMFPLSAR